MNRRGNINIIGGDLDNLSPEDRNKLLDKVKEKLVERINPDSSKVEEKPKEEQPKEEQPKEEQSKEEVVEETQEEPQEEEPIDDSEEPTDESETDETDEIDENAPTIKLTASNSTGKGNKDKDLMSDTGGSGKHHIKPYDNPPRDDCKKRYNYDKIKREDRADYRDTVGDPDLKQSFVRRGSKVR